MVGWSLAIDFGTIFTTAAMAVEDRIEFLEIEDSRYLPSMVCVGADGRLLVGREAVNEAALSPERAERLPKRAMATAEHVRLGGRTLATVDLVAAVLGHVREEATRRRGGRPERVVLTHPARWLVGGVELTRLARAASSAGLEAPNFVAEPVAAAHHYALTSGAALPQGSSVAVYDLGGGTFDTAVLRRNKDGFELAGPPGGDADLGGEDLDIVLIEVLAGHAEASDSPQWARLWEDSGEEGHRDRQLLRREVTKAKESLSHRTAVDIYLPGFPEEIRITRREYEAAVDGLLERSVAELLDTIAHAGATPASLTAVYLTGGSSRTPHITTLLSNVLGTLPTIEDDPKAVVAQGALEATSRTAPPRTEAGEKPASTVVLTPADLLSVHTNGAAYRRPLETHGKVVAVTGAPQAGKTSVVNALLGAEAVPYGRLPCADPSVLVRWADRPGGLMYRNGSNRPDWFSLEQLAGWAATSRAPGHMTHADVVFPSELLQEISLVDCATEDLLGSTATPLARLHVIDVTAPSSGPVIGPSPELLVLTKLDLVPKDERAAREQAVLDQWRRGPDDVPHVVVNAPRTLRALLKRSVGTYVSSGGAALLHAVRRLAETSVRAAGQ